MLGGKDTRIIYRHYATLYFVFVVDECESELGILDLIQVGNIISLELSEIINKMFYIKKRMNQFLL